MAQVSLQRTPDELKNPELNYFIAFKIDIKETDKAKIEPKIKTELSKTGGTLVQRRLIELKHDIIEIMCNDAVFDGTKYTPNSGARKKEAEVAKTFKIRETVDVIQMLCQTRKTLLKSELLTIYTSANKSVTYFTEEEFFQAIAFLSTLGVKIIDNTDVKIPFDKFNKAEKLLETVKKNDLYEYLGVMRTDSSEKIKDAANKVYQDAQRTSDLKKKQAGSQIDGVIKDILLNAQVRKAYDQYLLIKDKVWDEFAQRKSMGIKELHMDEYEKYVSIAISALKISIEEAEKILAIGCKYFQLTIVGKTEANSFEYCPYNDCGKLYIKGAKTCPHCGRPLEVMCWNCKELTRITKEDKGCASCGATFHSHELFNQRCQSLDLLLSRPSVEIGELQSALLQVKNVVPNYSAKPGSVVAKKVKDYEGIITIRVKQEETVGVKYKEEVVKIQQLIAKRCYQSALNTAKSLLVKYSNYNVENSRKLVADISAVVQTAQRQVDIAKQNIALGKTAIAIAAAVKALDICDDFIDARQIMQKYPPNSVSNLKLIVVKDKVRLEWSDVNQDFVTYTIIKKIGIAPTNAEDGSLVDRGLSVKFFEDVNIVSATPYYYAVFAERCGVKSSIAVTMSPATVFADVANMQQEVVEGGIKAVWEAPQNVKSIEVWRNSGTVAPLKAGEGVKLESSLTGFYDSKSTGQNAYLIVCNYDVKGKSVQSKGVRAVFKPYEKAVPLEDVKIVGIDKNKYAFSCTGDYSGKVKLYYSNTKLSIPLNTTLKYLDFNSICKGLMSIETTPNSNGDLVFTLPEGKIYQVYPMVSTEQLFIVSAPTLINTIDGLSHCAHTFANGVVTISGTLHPKAQAIIVRVSNDKFIEKVDGGGEKFSFKAEEFRRKSKIEIKLKTNTVNYISVFVEFKEDGVLSYSPVVKLDAPIDYREEVTVLYSLQYNVSAIRPFKLTINFEADSAVELPKMLIMQGSPKPLNKNAGKLCDRIEGVKLKRWLFSKKYTAKATITVSPVATNTKFALFLNEDSSFVQMKEVRNL